MLLKSRLSAHTVHRIAEEISARLYSSNLYASVGEVGTMRDGRIKVRFTLATEDSYGPGSRTSASGRHMPKASWQAHRDVMRAIFAADPDAFLHTALADYNGARDFEYKYEATGDKNVGSMMEPARMRDTAV